LTPRGNFDWPFVGILKSAATIWTSTSIKDTFYLAAALLAVATGIVGGLVVRDRLLRWLAWTWALVGITASTFVWDLGNNAARVLTPAFAFGVIALAAARRSRRPSRRHYRTWITSRRNLPV
jgi:hypothetical protein